MNIYEFGILGTFSSAQRDALAASIEEMITEFSLSLGEHVTIHDSASIAGRDKSAAFVAAYFGNPDHVDADIVKDIVHDNAPIIPTLAPTDNFDTHIPAFLQTLNGLRRRDDDPTLTELTSAMLEAVGLLRRQRRVFVSYRRVESQSAAVQLHDLLTARGFDVFLDTHDIRPGDPFQDVLWHRLSDSDVVVMLETPNYFNSKWTRQEFGRALAKEIHVLRVVWPDHQPSRQTDLATTIYLQPGEVTADRLIIPHKASEITLAVERVRGRSIASRYLSITGRLRSDVQKFGATVEGIGAHRAIAIRLPDDQRVWAYPVVGVPTAEVLNDIANHAQQADQKKIPVLVYDHVGIRTTWCTHLNWLNENIKTVQAIKLSEAAWRLAAWEG
ncbi:MAG: toll/interleukin-1 receptor domain-containing protein [Deltaproteobacteria bacterium]|nr:toll/interleukin-1 receptor domain-containing protein [Deltaproteobacteria bacterium]